MINKKFFGNSVLAGWFIFSLWAGVMIVKTYGEVLGSLFPLCIMLWILIIFQGRFAIEWLINKLWRS